MKSNKDEHKRRANKFNYMRITCIKRNNKTSPTIIISTSHFSLLVVIPLFSFLLLYDNCQCVKSRWLIFFLLYVITHLTADNSRRYEMR